MTKPNLFEVWDIRLTQAILVSLLAAGELTYAPRFCNRILRNTTSVEAVGVNLGFSRRDKEGFQ